MNKQEITETFYLSLIKFLLQAKQGVVSSSAELGLSSMQAFTLLLTDNSRPHSMNYFGKLYECDPSNITGIIDGLEQKGLVSRQEHPTDRRIKVIVLEPAGQKLKRQLMKILMNSNTFLFEALDSEETEQFISSIEKLSKHSLYNGLTSSAA
jgi:DNA-binding MarR family transcriptional regulator